MKKGLPVKFIFKKKIVDFIFKLGPTNLVPAVAVIREGQVLFILTGRKE
jgi:hypothetical protein